MKISVIVPSHNYGRYLEKCLSSIFSQALKPYEVIVVDDSSEDDTPEVVKKFPKARYYRVEFRNGNKTRNFGFEKSSGECLVFFDADNYMRRNFLRELSDVLEKNPRAAFSYCDRYEFDEGEELNPVWWRSQRFRVDELTRGNYIDLHALIRRSYFPGFDENLHRLQDWELWLDIVLRKGGIGIYVPKPLFYYRKHRQSVTARESWEKAYLYILEKYGFAEDQKQVWQVRIGRLRNKIRRFMTDLGLIKDHRVGRRVVISGGFGYSGLSDYATLKGILRQLSTLDPPPLIHVFDSNPQVAKKLLRKVGVVRPFRTLLGTTLLLSPLEVLRSLAVFLRANILFSTGSVFSNIRWGRVQFALLLEMALAHILGKKLVLYSLELEDPKPRLFRSLASWVFSRADLIMVRDPYSKEILKRSWSISRQKVFIVPDPTFLLPEKVELIRRAQNYVSFKFGSKRPGFIIGVAIGTGEEERYEMLAKVLDRACGNRSVHVLFLTGSDPTELLAAQKIINCMKNPSKVAISDPLEDPELLRYMISEVDVLISAGLYPIVLGILDSKPFISLINNPRVEYLMELLDLKGQVVRPLYEQEVNLLLDQAVVERDSLVQKLKGSMPRIKKKARRGGAYFTRLYHEGS